MHTFAFDSVIKVSSFVYLKAVGLLQTYINMLFTFFPYNWHNIKKHRRNTTFFYLRVLLSQAITLWIYYIWESEHSLRLQLFLTFTLLNKLFELMPASFKILSICLKFGRDIGRVTQRLVWFQAVLKGLTIMISRLKVKLNLTNYYGNVHERVYACTYLFSLYVFKYKVG